MPCLHRVLTVIVPRSKRSIHTDFAPLLFSDDDPDLVFAPPLPQRDPDLVFAPLLPSVTLTWCLHLLCPQSDPDLVLETVTAEFASPLPSE